MKQFLSQSALLLVILFFILSCASPKITYDFDDDVDFNNYNSFAISANTTLQLGVIDSARFIKTMVQVLEKKGLKQSENPDILIYIIRKAQKAESNSSIGVGVGKQTRNVGINIGGAIPIKRNATTQMLTLDFRERRTNRLIWQSHSSNTYKNNLNPDQKQAMYFKLFSLIFEGYPPVKVKK